MKFKQLVALPFLLMICSALHGQNTKQTYVCNFTGGNITIDGNETEGTWKDIKQIAFIAHDKEKLKARTWFKSAWDNEYLYFLCWMQDDDIQAQMTKRDDHVWHEEALEIFIDADANPKTYYEFEWNALNTLLDLFVLNPNYNRDVIRQWWAWDCARIVSAVQIKGTLSDSSDADEGWFLEVAIPFSQIETAQNIPPAEGDIWKLDLTRREGTEREGTLQKSSWLPPSTHFPLSYGQLIFKK